MLSKTNYLCYAMSRLANQRKDISIPLKCYPLASFIHVNVQCSKVIKSFNNNVMYMHTCTCTHIYMYTCTYHMNRSAHSWLVSWNSIEQKKLQQCTCTCN